MIQKNTLLIDLDRWVGDLTPWFLWHVLPRLSKRSLESGQTLLIRPGGMGDLVCLQMAIESQGFPIDSFTFLIERRSEPWAIFMGLDYVCYDTKKLKHLQKLFGRYPRVICTEQRFGLALAYGIACLARRGELYAFETCRGARHLPIKLTPYAPDQDHEILAFSKLLHHAFPECPSPKPPAPRPRRFPVGTGLIVCIAGSNHPSRSLDAHQWAKVIQAWAGRASISLTFAPRDNVLALDIQRQLGQPCSLIAGDFSEVVTRVSQAEAVLTMDGGMVHVASYFGIPTTAMFTSGQPEKWAPLGLGSRVVTRGALPCQPCARFGQVPRCPNCYECRNLSSWDLLDFWQG